MWSLALACSSPPLPPGVPADAVRLTHDATTIRVDPREGWFGAGSAELPIDGFAADPTEPVDPQLVGAIGQASGGRPRPVFLDLPPETPFWMVRRMVGSAREAGAPATWIGVGGAAVELPEPPRFALAACAGAPVTVTGAEPLLTFSLQTGPEGAWLVASARFVPVSGAGPVDGLDRTCLTVPPCDELFPDGPLRAACAEAGGPSRVELGGPSGCILPIARGPAEGDQWRAELAPILTDLGVADHPLRVVMPEAMSRIDTVLGVVGAFVDAGMPAPGVGTAALVEGNDGPPVCNAPVRDRAALAEAGARWLGTLRPPELVEVSP